MHEALANPEMLLESSAPQEAPAAKVIKANAVYNYQKDRDSDLQLTVGEVVTVLSKNDNGWWHGEGQHGVGDFPSNYVVEILQEENPAVPSRTGIMSKPYLKKMELPQDLGLCFHGVLAASGSVWTLRTPPHAHLSASVSPLHCPSVTHVHTETQTQTHIYAHTDTDTVTDTQRSTLEKHGCVTATPSLFAGLCSSLLTLDSSLYTYAAASSRTGEAPKPPTETAPATATSTKSPPQSPVPSKAPPPPPAAPAPKFTAGSTTGKRVRVSCSMGC
jgi:SH3 domain